MRKSWDEYRFDLVAATAERGTCPRRQVGALLVKSNKDYLPFLYRGRAVGRRQTAY